MLTQTFRDVMPKAKALGSRMVEQLDDIIAQFSGLWNVQHKDSGAHSDITADSIVVSGDLTVEGDVTIEGTTTLENIVVVDLTAEKIRSNDIGPETANPGPNTLGNDIGVETGPWAFIWGYVIQAYTSLKVGGLGGTTTMTHGIVSGGLEIDKSVLPATDDTYALGQSSPLARWWTNLFLKGRVFEVGRTTGMGVNAAYTPTWTGSGTNPTLNDGTLTGRFNLVGNQCNFEIRLLIGATTVLATGLWGFSLPVAMADNTLRRVLGPALMEDNGNSDNTGTAFSQGGANALYVALDGAAAGYLTDTTPFAFAVGDFVSIRGSYEI